MRKVIERVFPYFCVLLLGLLLSACGKSENAIAATTVATAAAPAPETPIPTKALEISRPMYDYSEWETYHSPNGYAFNFPPKFDIEVRNASDSGNGDDFVALFLEKVTFETVFSVQVAGERGGLEGKREFIMGNLENVTFSALDAYGLTGYIYEGTLPEGNYGGGSVVFATYFELGEMLIHLDCPWNVCERDTFELILQSFRLE